MRIRDRFDGRESPFEGDRELVLKRLPAGVKVASARAIVTPELFIGTVDLTGGTSWGATRTLGQSWVEVDFHARRTLAAVSGSNLVSTSLLVDPGGGVFTDVNARGALGGSASDLFRLQGGSPHPLPGLAVSRFRLAAAGPSNPTVTGVEIRSLPSNVRLSLVGQAPFWTQPGELAQAVTSPDFGTLLGTFLTEATVENGFVVLPLVVHSDTLAGLLVEIEVDVLKQESVLPEGLDEVALSFDHGGLPAAEPLQIALPANARVREVRGRASGAFAASQVVLGPTGEVDAPEAAEVSASASQAQLLALDAALAADGVDLRLAAVSRTARLELDVMEDLDGKPGGASFLPAAVPVALDRESAGKPTWVSVALPAELQLKARAETRYWLALRSLEGEAVWTARGAPAGAAPLQETRDGGLSWRQSGRAPRAALFRLRRKTERFRVPVELQVGTGASAERISLQRFAPLGRVDLRFDVPEVAAGFNRYLASAAAAPCSESEHLANGDFSQWLGIVPSVVTSPAASAPPSVPAPAEWAVTAGSVLPLPGTGPGAILGLPASRSDRATGLSQVAPVGAACAYDFTFSARATHEGAVAEVHWLGDGCGPLRSDAVAIDVAVEDLIPVLHRARLASPPAATQAEVRFLVPDGEVLLDRVSLQGTANAVFNGDLRARAGHLPAGWEQLPADEPLEVAEVQRGIRLEDKSGDAVSLLQTVAARADAPFTVEVQAVAPSGAPRAEVRWLRADGSETGEPTVLAMAAGGGFESFSAGGKAPADAVEARVELAFPPQASAELRQVDLRFPELQAVPATFVAEAPGELKVQDWQVVWEPVAVPPPALPPGGLRSPTPPGFEPGELDDCDCCCAHCGSRHELTGAEPRLTGAGRAVQVASCASCGERIMRFGGPPVAGAPRLRGADLPAPPRAVVVTAAAPASAPPLPLTSIQGIGEKRAELLAAAGLETLEALAQTVPGVLLRVLPRVSEEMAEGFVAEAAQLLAAGQRQLPTRSRPL